MFDERHLAAALIAAIGSVSLISTAHAAGPLSRVGAFCAANPNNDNPAKAFYGPRLFKPGQVPQEVARSGANTWRCMGGRVWVCSIGADGYACQKLNPDPAPSKPVRDYCAANPGSDFVPMVVIGASASTWRCAGRLPRPLQTQALDQRNFIRKSWRPLPR
jgi:hypothetical protein